MNGKLCTVAAGRRRTLRSIVRFFSARLFVTTHMPVWPAPATIAAIALHDVEKHSTDRPKNFMTEQREGGREREKYRICCGAKVRVLHKIIRHSS